MLNIFAISSVQNKQLPPHLSDLPEVLSINYQDKSVLLSLNNGFRIYANNGDLKYKKEFKDGGVGHIQFVSPSTVLLVGGGPIPIAPASNILFYDIETSKTIGELLCTNPVRNTKSLFDGKILLVALESGICIYRNAHDSAKKKHFSPKYALERKIESYENTKGLLCAFASGDGFTLLYPSTTKGFISVEKFKLDKECESQNMLSIKAHENPIACMAIAEDGSKFATCSEQGTLVRIFAMNGTQIKELRRGTSEAHIYSIAFSLDSTMLCVTSSSTTVHIFSLKDEDKVSTWASFFVSYEPSIAQYKELNYPALCYFDPSNQNNIILITSIGDYIHLQTKVKGQYEKVSEKNMLL